MPVSLPRRNRVTPFGDFEAVSARGLFMGNRGRLVPGRAFGTRAWVCCRTEFRGRRAVFDSPRHYTPLFFTDEAVALAAGHRPCGACRNGDYKAFKAAFGRAFGIDRRFQAREMDRALHAARLRHGRTATFEAALGDLPDGTFVVLPHQPERALLVARGALHPWSHEGYGAPLPLMPGARTRILTPAPTVAVLRAGYGPRMALMPQDA